MENAILTNQKTTLLLNGWPRTIAETMATATKFMRLFCFRCNSSLANSTQLGDDSNYSKFNGEKIATNCSRVTALALDGLTKKNFGHYALLKLSLRSPRRIGGEGIQNPGDKGPVILASVSFWPLLIIESVARVSHHVLFTHVLLVKQV